MHLIGSIVGSIILIVVGIILLRISIDIAKWFMKDPKAVNVNTFPGAATIVIALLCFMIGAIFTVSGTTGLLHP